MLQKQRDNGVQIGQDVMRRRLAVSALKEIRRAVDQHAEEERFARRFSRLVLAFLSLLLLGLVIATVFGAGPAAFRLITGLVSMSAAPLKKSMVDRPANSIGDAQANDPPQTGAMKTE